MAKHSIQNDLDQLVAVALISPEQAVAISAYYQQEKRSTKAMLLLPLVGVLLIGAGFISLCAANWQNMGDSFKLLFGFLPLCLLGFFLWKNRESPSETLIQSLTFGVGFATLATYGIVSNVYQTPVATEILMRLCLLSLVPLVYVFNAYWLGVLLTAWGIYAGGLTLELIPLLCLVALFPYGYFRFQEERNMKCLTLLLIVSAYRVIFLLCPEPFTFVLCVAGMLLLYPFFPSEYYQRITQKTFLYLGLVFSVVGGAMGIEPDPLCVLLYLGAIAYVVYHCYQFEDNKDELLFYGQAVVVLIAMLFSSLGLNIYFILTLFMLGFIGYRAYRCYMDQDLKGYNKESFCFAGLVLVHMTMLSMGFFATGVLYIVIGMAFLFLSKIVSDSIKKGREIE